MKKSVPMVVFLGLLMSVSAVSYAEQGREQGEGKQKRTPPPEALAACNTLKSGDVCQFMGKRGDTLKGTCFAPAERPLACKPTNATQEPQS